MNQMSNSLNTEISNLNTELDQISLSPVASFTDIRAGIVARWNERLVQKEADFKFLESKNFFSRLLWHYRVCLSLENESVTFVNVLKSIAFSTRLLLCLAFLPAAAVVFCIVVTFVSSSGFSGIHWTQLFYTLLKLWMMIFGVFNFIWYIATPIYLAFSEVKSLKETYESEKTKVERLYQRFIADPVFAIEKIGEKCDQIYKEFTERVEKINVLINTEITDKLAALESEALILKDDLVVACSKDAEHIPNIKHKQEEIQKRQRNLDDQKKELELKKTDAQDDIAKINSRLNLFSTAIAEFKAKKVFYTQSKELADRLSKYDTSEKEGSEVIRRTVLQGIDFQIQKLNEDVGWASQAMQKVEYCLPSPNKQELTLPYKKVPALTE